GVAAKYRYSDGALLWKHTPAAYYRDLRTAAVDGAGDVYIAGEVWVAFKSYQAYVAKLSGTDGTPIWTAAATPGATSFATWLLAIVSRVQHGDRDGRHAARPAGGHATRWRRGGDRRLARLCHRLLLRRDDGALCTGALAG